MTADRCRIQRFYAILEKTHCLSQSPRHSMIFLVKRLCAGFAIAAVLSASSAHAGSVGDFFKALGNSIAHPGQKKTAPKPQPKKPKTKSSQQSADYPPTSDPTPPPTPTATATTSQPPVRPASVPPTKNSKRDIPYAIPVPNKAGFVTSPYAPKAGYVDVRGFPSGTEVKDPYSGKTFLTP
jgi:cytoskeletal protein RodZ